MGEYNFRNHEKLEIFIENYNKGYIEYENGRLFRTHKNLGDRYKKMTNREEMRIGLGKSNGRYYRVCASKKGKRYTAYEHVVIFAIHHGIESLKSYETIDHVDGNKYNNKIENLEGVTVEENNRRLMEMGLLKPQKGTDNGASKLSNEDIIKIRNIYKNRELNQYQLSEMFGVSQGHISVIVNKKLWSHI